MVDLGEGVGQSIHGGGNKQDERRWKILGKMGNARGIIQGDNSAWTLFCTKGFRGHQQKTFVTPSRFWPLRGRG